ncbi:MAG: hypothetical protein JRJ54_04915 [Deltaproteobacteria bacterium]|nr:hypothetical protein [Deltaproteobacteria bacterium]
METVREWARMGRAMFGQFLSESGQADAVTVAEEGMGDGGWGCILEATFSSGKRLFLLEVRPSGEPRRAREAVNALLVQTHRRPELHPVFVAPYISEQAAEICREHGIGFMDLAGNCRIAAGGFYVDIRGRPNPFKNTRRLKTLTASKTARILRVLFNHPRRPWKIRDLAAEAGVSLGLVSNAGRILRDREWIDPGQRRILLTRPRELIEYWTTSHPPTDRRTFFFTEDDFLCAENKIIDYCNKMGYTCAFTGISAAVHLASGIRRYRQVQVRISGKATIPAEDIGFEPADPARANVVVIHSPDLGVFYGMRPIPPVSRLQYCRPMEKTVAAIEAEARVPMAIVSPVQAYVDLKTAGDNGGEEAEKVFRQVLEPSW